jgi:hypothetical protein
MGTNEFGIGLTICGNTRLATFHRERLLDDKRFMVCLAEVTRTNGIVGAAISSSGCKRLPKVTTAGYPGPGVQTI